MALSGHLKASIESNVVASAEKIWPVTLGPGARLFEAPVAQRQPINGLLTG